MNDVVDKILNETDTEKVFLKLWIIAILYHRQPESEKAWNELKKITNENIVNTMSFMSGLLIAGNPKTTEETLKSFL